MDIDSYESPEAEALLRAAKTRRNRRVPIGHELVTHLLAALVFLAAAASLAAVAPWTSSLSVAALALFIAMYVAAASVRFPVGSLWAYPTQLVFVPMLLLLPAPVVPAAVGAAMLLARAPDVVRGRITVTRLIPVIGDCLYSLGPALVLVAAGSPSFGWSHWALYLGAFGAQVALDSASTVLRCWFAEGIKPRDQLPPMVWTFGVDLALSTAGLLIASAAVGRAGLVLLSLPLIGLLGLFARERHERLDQVLTLSSAYRGTALLLADVVEADDYYTGEHSRGVLELSLGVSDALGLDATRRRVVEFAALLHDVGKIRVPKTIITKQGPLDDEEWTIIRRHTIDGEAMLCQVGGALVEVGRIVRASHERWDGQGYPDGLVGEQIPLEARIVTACDSYSAMTTKRSYSPGRSAADALTELERCAGSQFDPRVVATLRELILRELAAAGASPVAPERPAPTAVDKVTDSAHFAAAIISRPEPRLRKRPLEGAGPR
ncbi:MAG: HD-GYP domain-containing protein [Solirubrobacteraceae bacterium]